MAVRPGACQTFLAGDRARRDAAVADAGRDAAKRNDVIVLAQASLVHLQQGLGEPVLPSLGLLVGNPGVGHSWRRHRFSKALPEHARLAPTTSTAAFMRVRSIQVDRVPVDPAT